jgi:precorrin-8X/cobalt-precorrin-8 methylmutase
MTLGQQHFRLVLAGHGSRSERGYEEFQAFTELFRRRFPETSFRHGYLEFNKPSIQDAVAAVVQSGGSGPIVVVPALLATATHVKNDLPLILQSLQQQYPTEDIRFANVLDLHAKLLELCSQRITEAEAGSQNLISRADTCLVVVGRGTSDPDANGDIAKITRILHEGLKFGASHVCYSGTTFPLVAEGLKQAAKLGFRRLIVLPYFLFDGILVQRVYAAADALERRLGGETEILKARYLGVEPATAEVFLERAMEAVDGTASMNCMVCKYRVPVVGYENELHKPQEAHRAKLKGSEYVMHPIEAESFAIIRAQIDSSSFPEETRGVVERLIHTTGEFGIIDDLFISKGAVQIGVDALLRCRRIVTDVTMVQTGLRRSLLSDLKIETWCGVHHKETWILAETAQITRSAAGIRRAWSLFGNDVVVAIGDAPTAVAETVRLIKEAGWRPQLVIGLPVGFVGTAESKESLKGCLQVPRITNRGTRGGSPWAAATVNALLIEANNKVFGNAGAQI